MADEFTFQSYRDLIEKLKDKYTFTGYQEYGREGSGKERGFAIMRHDVDISMEKAYTMATLEHEYGIMANYFIYLRSPFFNPFSKHSLDYLERIIDLGHNIGLHFYTRLYPDITPENSGEYIGKEMRILELLSGKKVFMVSFHRPDYEFVRRIKVAGCANAYGEVFTSQFHYISDSRGEWRYGHPLESRAFKNGENIHILTHPMWYNTRSIPPKLVLERLMKESTREYIRNLGENYIPWEKEIR